MRNPSLTVRHGVRPGSSVVASRHWRIRNCWNRGKAPSTTCANTSTRLVVKKLHLAGQHALEAALRTLIYLLLSNVFSATAADALNPRWVQHEGGLGASSGDWVSNVQRDAAGNVFVTGYFLKDTVIANTYLTETGYFIVKYTPDGEPVWVKHSEAPASFHVDPEGNVYQVGGLLESAVVGATNLFATNGASYVAKFTPGGDFVWAAQGGGSNDYPGVAALAADATGIFVVGGYYGAAKFGDTNVPTATNRELFLAKLSHAGTWLWVRTEGRAHDDRPAALRVLSDGSLALSLSRWGIEGGIPELRRYTAAGSLLWTQNVAGTWAMAVDAADNIYVGSGFQGQPTVAGQRFTNTWSEADDILLTKFAANGTRLWTQHIRGNGDDRLGAVAMTPAGRICLSGTFGDSETFNIVTASFSGLVLTNPAAGPTGFIAEYNSDGSIHRAVPTISGTFSSGMTVLDDGDWCVAGSFMKVKIGNSELTTRGLLDFYVARLTTNVVAVPAITLNTVSHALAAGEPVVMQASAANSTAQFQWLLNGTNIPGATNATLTIASASTNHNGRYSVVVRTPSATVVNSTTALLVNPETDIPWPLWVMRAKATNWSTVHSLEVSTNGDCYVAGTFDSRSALGTNILLGMSGSTFVAKLNADGSVAWAHGLKPLSPSYASIYDCRVASGGDVYVLCFFTAPAQHDDGQTFPAGLLLSKYNSSGVLQWGQKVGTTNLNYSKPRLALAPQGAAFVASSYSGEAAFGSTNLAGPVGAFVAEYTPQGALVSVRQADPISSIALTTNAIYYARNSSELVKTDRLWNTVSSRFVGTGIRYIIPLGEHLWLLHEDGLLRKLNAAGQTLWHQTMQLGGPPALSVGASGHAYVAGTVTSGKLIGDRWFSTIDNTPDILVVECDPSGIIVSTRQLGGANAEQANAIGIGPADTLYVGGTIPGDLAMNGTVSLGTVSSEAFVARFDVPPSSYPPRLEIVHSPTQTNLRWLTRDTNWILQSSPVVSGLYVSDSIANISRGGRTNTYIRVSTNQMFFRLQRTQ